MISVTQDGGGALSVLRWISGRSVSLIVSLIIRGGSGEKHPALQRILHELLKVVCVLSSVDSLTLSGDELHDILAKSRSTSRVIILFVDV